MATAIANQKKIQDGIFIASGADVVSCDTLTRSSNGYYWPGDSFKPFENGKYTVTENGTYTVYLCTNAITYNLSQDIRMIANVEVTGIKSAKKPTVKLISYKAGSKQIKGTATAESVVYLRVGGKTYKKMAGTNKKFTIKLSSKLKSGQTIQFYAKNENGNSGLKKCKVK